MKALRPQCKIADIAQPLGGEYAARRDAVEVLPFVEGWGVELGLLVDVVERFGNLFNKKPAKGEPESSPDGKPA